LRDCRQPLLRGDALARCVALEAAHPGVALRELQSRLADPELASCADRALSELALAALERVGRAPPAACEATQLLDAACAVALLVSPDADVSQARLAVARLAAAARTRLRALGLQDAPPLACLDALNAFLFAAPAEAAATSLLDAPLPAASEPTHGCGFGGGLAAYYTARNSSVVELLRTRRGLPIVLAVLHVVVAAAAGVALRPCGVPNQFMTRTPEDFGGEAGPFFFDVFEGAKMRSRDELLDFIAAMGVVPDEHLLAPTAPREVAARMLRNLLHLSGAGASSGLRPSAILHLHSAMLSLHSATLDMRLARFSHACDAGEVHLAQRDYDALAAGEDARALQPEHRRQMLRVAKQQLDAAYELAAGAETSEEP